MAARTPPLFATGKWVVEQPYTVEQDTIYICKAVRSLDDIEAQGGDPFVRYYEPLGITREDYDRDVLSMANIVTLMSSTAPTLYIPDTYIISFPDTTSMPYSHVVLSVSLGAVPDTLSMDDTQQKIADLVLNTLGIETVVNVHLSGVLSEGMDYVTHNSLENQRLTRIANNLSSYAQLNEKDTTIDALRDKVRALEQIIIDKGLLD